MRDTIAMAPSLNGNTGGPSTPSMGTESKPSLATSLRNTRKKLKAIDERRNQLQDEIKIVWDAISKLQSDYWVGQSDAFKTYVEKGGENDFENWRRRFANKESRNAKDVAKKQHELRAQIDRNQEELQALDAAYWSEWQDCLTHLSEGPNKKTPHALREAKATNSAGPSGLLRPRRVASSSTPQQSAAARSRLTRQSAVPRLAKSSPTNATKAVTRNSRKQKQRAQAFSSIQPNSPQGVSNPIPGQIYQAFYRHDHSSERGWYMGIVLPWNGDHWRRDLNLDFSMAQMDLKDDFPESCIPELTHTEKQDEHGNTVSVEALTAIKGWAPGFEDGGPRVEDRSFLFLFFDDRNKRPGTLNIPKRAGKPIKFTKADLKAVPIDWVAAKHLRPANVDDGTLVRGRITAGKFKKMMDRLHSAAAAPLSLDGTMDEDPEAGSDGDATRHTGLSTNTSRLSAEDSFTEMQQAQTDGNAQQEENMPDSDARAAGALLDLHSSHRGQGPGRSASFQPAADDKMDIDEDYDPILATSPTQLTGPEKDESNKFDEGVGMDYDLQFVKCTPLLPPLRNFASQGSQGHHHQQQLTPQTGGTPTGGQSSPLRPPENFYHPVATPQQTRRFASTDSGWQSHGGTTGSDD